MLLYQILPLLFPESDELLRPGMLESLSPFLMIDGWLQFNIEFVEPPIQIGPY